MEYLLEEIRYLVKRPELETISEEDLRGLLQTIRNTVYKEKVYPVFRTEGFLYTLDGSLNADGFRAKVIALDESSPFPTREDIEEAMSHYGVHGSARFSFDRGPYDGYNFVRFNLVVFRAELASDTYLKSLPILSPSHARMLNLKVEGKTQKEIAGIEGCSVSTVAQRLHHVLYKSDRYGFWQIWPESVEMRFSDKEYADALRSRGKVK